ncbi:thiamine phosphate synthase [Alkaliphilus sp. B6464]|uniref:thiamine phosphate synthase n=1 Tax=Alkaliphilus sp. B6464 TaxID=2731219 RepID=UPI001BA99268|nr:thiamine phosphate synthase [Alkaliphilus sp. B6464]QUH19225.1 thiamine phosphate synthase [Alkaliphilus sp. B6464]
MKSNRNINYELYLVSDRDVLGGRDFIRSLEEAILGGVTLIQLREKSATSSEFYSLAVKVKELTYKYNIPLIINDRLDIALAVDADGVHVGQDDMPANVVRDILGKDKIVGVSTATLEEALKAIEDGADYIGVGALFPTDTKTDTRIVTLDQLKNIKENINIPVVGIGGINESNIKSVSDTGIDGVAIVSAILGKQDIREAAVKLYNDFSRK